MAPPSARTRRAERGRGAATPSEKRRHCIASGDVRDASELIRFVVGLRGEVVPDVAGKLPGRGIWLGPSRDLVARALAKGLFARAAREQTSAAPGLADRIEQLLAERCLGLLGLARRSGQAVTGFERVGALVRAGEAAMLIVASDAAADGRGKLERLGAGLPVVDMLSRTELSLALGRENVVHAGLTAGGLAARLAVEARRLAGFRAGSAPS